MSLATLLLLLLLLLPLYFLFALFFSLLQSATLLQLLSRHESVRQTPTSPRQLPKSPQSSHFFLPNRQIDEGARGSQSSTGASFTLLSPHKDARRLWASLAKLRVQRGCNAIKRKPRDLELRRSGDGHSTRFPSYTTLLPKKKFDRTKEEKADWLLLSNENVTASKVRPRNQNKSMREELKFSEDTSIFAPQSWCATCQAECANVACVQTFPYLWRSKVKE